MPYSAKFKQKMIEKMTGPSARSATSLSKEVGVAQATLSRWLARAKLEPMTNRKERGAGRRRSPEEKVRLVMEAAGLGEDALGVSASLRGVAPEELRAG